MLPQCLSLFIVGTVYKSTHFDLYVSVKRFMDSGRQCILSSFTCIYSIDIQNFKDDDELGSSRRRVASHRRAAAAVKLEEADNLANKQCCHRS